MKKGRFYTDNSLWNQHCKKLLLRRGICLSKLIISVPNAIKVSGVAHVYYISSMDSCLNKICCFGNTTLFYNNLFCYRSNIHVFTNFRF